jgi:hypothetical protein
MNHHTGELSTSCSHRVWLTDVSEGELRTNHTLRVAVSSGGAIALPTRKVGTGVDDRHGQPTPIHCEVDLAGQPASGLAEHFTVDRFPFRGLAPAGPYRAPRVA